MPKDRKEYTYLYYNNAALAVKIKRASESGGRAEIFKRQDDGNQ